ncbi:MAG TPA: porin family protein [Ferruginibacter sp.]|nr:porin family protein [Ferruginibacter sp.]
MKSILSVALAAILMSGSAKAQSVNFGIKGGLNLYTLNDERDVKYDSKPGVNVGLLAHIHLAPQLGLQPEVVYSLQGAKSTVANIETKLNLGYINVPVMLQYMFDNGFRLQAGPQVGFLISGKSEIKDEENNIKDQFKTVDFGVGAGLGYVHPASGFGVDARYNLGLSDITESDLTKMTNRGFQLGVFYLFNHKN